MCTVARRWLGHPYDSTSYLGKLRRQRWELLLRFFPNLSEMSVLDLGGSPEAWVAAPVQPKALTVLNIESRQMVDSGSDAELVQGDACEVTRRLAGRRFDLVYSNSLIEHVGGHFRRQQLAREITEIADRYWVQTPSRYFPVEPHWWLPGLQFLPVRLRVWVTRHAAVGPRTSRGASVAASVDSVQWVELLSATELQAYFPDAAVLRERFAGLTKSLIALH